ncbi:hypothetical protein [Gillisia sp. Hel_I_29]|uniref:DUF7793 family protein n=1 Tax=Gillisia sp. Hel_I_29 TaxID=1249975 RepID=UPI000556DD49|nr:hypothetical protein [Gillisia sp. Hel_I_29]
MIKGEDYAHFWIDEGILHFVYKPNTIIDLTVAKAIVKDRLRFQNGISYPILCDVRHLKTANKASREFLAEKGCYSALAIALVIEREYLGTLTKAFINISNPSVPTREFTSVPKALSFLFDYK